MPEKTILGTISTSSAAQKLSLSITNKTLYQGESITIKVNNLGNKKATWSTSNKSVVTVSSKGVVKAVGIGNATISAKVGKTTLKASIRVVRKQEGQSQYAAMSNDELLELYKKVKTEIDNRNLKAPEAYSLNEGRYIVGQDVQPGTYQVTCTATDDDELSKSFNSLGSFYDGLDKSSGTNYSELFSTLGSLYSSIGSGMSLEIIGDYGSVIKSIHLKKGETAILQLEGKVAVKVSDGSCTLEKK